MPVGQPEVQIYRNLIELRWQNRDQMTSFLKISALFVLVISITACTKPKVHELRPIEYVTFDSRESFGCRVNGRLFSPKAADSSLMGDCSYRVTYADASRVFQITANRSEADCRYISITITLDSVDFSNVTRYRLGSPGLKKNYAQYSFIRHCSADKVDIFTSDDIFGVVVITRYDPQKKIVRGTFEFSLRAPDGFMYNVSDGVFDRHYKE